MFTAILFEAFLKGLFFSLKLEKVLEFEGYGILLTNLGVGGDGTEFLH